MIHVPQFRTLVVRPTLKKLNLWSQAAENLLLGTAAQESNFKYLKQIRGPALGFYQMEPATHEDIWNNYLHYKAELNLDVAEFVVKVWGRNPDKAQQMVWNLAYATAMCRVHYLRVPERLPKANDIEALGQYWKRHYNTPKGRGTVREFVANYKRYIEEQPHA